MPLPTPKPGEKQDAYVSRCISVATGHEKAKPKDKRRPAKQVQAMCFERYRQRGKSISEIVEDYMGRITKLESK